MKKIIAILLCLSIIFTLSVVALGADCAHSSMTREFVAATCVSRAKNVYTCSCGHVEETYLKPSYSLTDGKLSFLFEGEAKDGKLTITCTAFGNPGICGSIFTVYYNADALTPVSMENGTMWDEDDAILTINTSKKYVKFFAEGWGNNTNSGVVFTAEFDVKDVPANWGIKVNTIPQDFCDWDTGKVVSHEVVSTITSGYGSHVWDDGVVSVKPTVYDAGTMLHSCTFCSEEKTESIPTLEKWTKGDVNNDGNINVVDIFSAKSYLINGNISYGSQEFDAADMNGDLNFNVSDLMMIKSKLLK